LIVAKRASYWDDVTDATNPYGPAYDRLKAEAKPRGSISLIVKGPIKSAKRAAARHGVSLASCRVVGSGKFGDVQCYAACKPKTNHGVVQWFGSRSRSKADRGFPPGTLLYHGAFCSTGKGLGRARKKRR
jgi:hypothetical protein